MGDSGLMSRPNSSFSTSRVAPASGIDSALCVCSLAVMVKGNGAIEGLLGGLYGFMSRLPAVAAPVPPYLLGGLLDRLRLALRGLQSLSLLLSRKRSRSRS